MKGHLNRFIGSKVTAIFVNGGILPSGGVASGRVCACSLRRRLVYSIYGGAQGDQLVLSVATERGSQVFALPSQRQIARYSQIPGTVRYQVQPDKRYSQIPDTARYQIQSDTKYSQIKGTARYQVQPDKRYSQIPGTARYQVQPDTRYSQIKGIARYQV